MDIPPHWQRQRLKFLALVNPPRQDHRSFDLGDSFVPVGQIGFGQLNPGLAKPLKETRRHSYVCFRDGDVIIANILSGFQRGKCALASCLVNGIGFTSSGHHRGLMVAFSPTCCSRTTSAASHMRGGAGQKRVPREFIANYPFPLSQQRAIADCLDQVMSHVDRLRALRSASAFYLRGVTMNL